MTLQTRRRLPLQEGLIFIRNETVDFENGRQVYFSPFESFIERAHERDLPIQFVLPATERGVRLASSTAAERTTLIGNARGFFTGLRRTPEMVRQALRLRKKFGFNTVVVRVPEHVSLLLLPLLRLFGFQVVAWLVHDRRKVQEADLHHRKGLRAGIAALASALNGWVEQRLLWRGPVISNGTALAQSYCNGNPRARVVYSTLLNEADMRDLGSCAQNYAHRSGELNLIYAGRISVEKGIDRLFDFLEEMQRQGMARGVTCTLTLVGKLDDSMRQYVAERQFGLADPTCVRLAGFVKRGPDLWKIYREMDFFCLLSKAEGTPRVVPEAYAAGMPVVISTDANSDAIVDVEGLVTDAGALAKTATHVLDLHADRARYLDLRARLRDRSHDYTIDRILDVFLEQIDPPSGEVVAGSVQPS